MGTIAARDALRVLELTEQVAAGLLIAVRQGITLRQNLNAQVLTEELTRFMGELEKIIPFITEDRQLDGELKALLAQLRQKSWSLYA